VQVPAEGDLPVPRSAQGKAGQITRRPGLLAAGPPGRRAAGAAGAAGGRWSRRARWTHFRHTGPVNPLAGSIGRLRAKGQSDPIRSAPL
jgi:hypothetical protein